MKLTIEEEQKLLETRYHKSGLFLLVKQGAYYRPFARGYTYSLAEAGRWTESEAMKQECSKGQPYEVKKVPVPPPSYHTDHEAINQILFELTDEEWDVFVQSLIRKVETEEEQRSKRIAWRKLFTSTTSEKASAICGVIQAMDFKRQVSEMR